MFSITTFKVNKDVLSLIKNFKERTILCLQEMTNDLGNLIIAHQKNQGIWPRLVHCWENAIYLSPDIRVWNIKEVHIWCERSFIGVDFEINEKKASVYSWKLAPWLSDYKRKKWFESLLSQIEEEQVVIWMDSNMWYPQEKKHVLIPLKEKYWLDYHFWRNLERCEHRSKFPMKIFSDNFLKRHSIWIDWILWRGFRQIWEGIVHSDITSSDHSPVSIHLK